MQPCLVALTGYDLQLNGTTCSTTSSGWHCQAGAVRLAVSSWQCLLLPANTRLIIVQ
jgi:hypothetical protein